jgi:hypothetical protein
MLKYMSNHCNIYNIMNMLYRWKIEHKYYADVEAQFAGIVSFVYQGIATSVCTKDVICTDKCTADLWWEIVE